MDKTINTKMILYLILLSSLVLSSGYPGASFQYDINSRNVSLGGTTVSSKHIGFNAFSNPASLAQINKLEIGFSNFIMSLDRTILAASIERVLPGTAGAGISIVRVGVSDIKGYDSDGNPEEIFSVSETMLLLSFGKSINKNFNFGFNLKYFYNNLYFSNSSSIGFDLGFKASWLIPKRLKMFGNQVSLGLKIENIGNQYLWKTEDGLYTRQYCQKFPINFKLGSSLKSNKYMILFQQDIVSINPYGNYLCQYDDSNSTSRSYLFNPRLGFEYNIKKGLDFRCGLKKNSNFNNSRFMVFAGLGIDYMYKNKPLKFDYAIDLGVNSEGWSHNFTTSLYLK